MVNDFDESKKKDCAVSKLQILIRVLNTALRSRYALAVLFFIIGVSSVIAYQNYDKYRQYKALMEYKNYHNLEREYKNLAKQQDEFFDNDFFYQPFNSMRKFHQEMIEDFARYQQAISENFKNIKSDQSNTYSASVSSEQDGNNLIYRLRFSGYNKDEIKISVKDRMLNISATKSSKSSQKEKDGSGTRKREQPKKEIKAESFTNNSFNYSFYINQNFKDQPQISDEDGMILISFAKTS